MLPNCTGNCNISDWNLRIKRMIILVIRSGVELRQHCRCETLKFNHSTGSIHKYIQQLLAIIEGSAAKYLDPHNMPRPSNPRTQTSVEAPWMTLANCSTAPCSTPRIRGFRVRLATVKVAHA